MTVNLNAATAATTAIPLSPSATATESGNINPAVSRRPHNESAPAPPSRKPESTSAAPAYTISSSATASASHANAKTSEVTGVQPDVDGDGARLLALQVQQDLSTQSSPIANASSTSILGLFKS